MSCIVYRKDSAGRVYAYSSESYWSKEKGQPRSKRTYLGRVNPETGEIIKGRQGGKNYKPKMATPVSEPDSDRQQLLDIITSKNAEIAEMQQDIRALQNQVKQMSGSLQKIAHLATSATSV